MAAKITAIGQTKLAAATAGNPLNITTFQVGDGNGATVTPDGTETALALTKHTGGVGSLTQETNQATIECVVPSATGGYTIRELGIFDADGDLIIYTDVPETVKPATGENAGKAITFNITVAFSSTDNVTVTIDGNTQVTNTQLNQIIDALIPKGSISAIATQNIPDGYLECDGAEISRTTYAALFAAIGETFGAGDGSTTFLLPDLRGEFIRGFDNGRGVDSGRQFGTNQSDELKSHTHDIADTVHANGGSNWWFTIGQTFGTNDYQTEATGGDETRPRNVALTYIIKY